MRELIARGEVGRARRARKSALTTISVCVIPTGDRESSCVARTLVRALRSERRIVLVSKQFALTGMGLPRVLSPRRRTDSKVRDETRSRSLHKRSHASPRPWRSEQKYQLAASLTLFRLKEDVSAAKQVRHSCREKQVIASITAERRSHAARGSVLADRHRRRCVSSKILPQRVADRGNGGRRRLS